MKHHAFFSALVAVAALVGCGTNEPQTPSGRVPSTPGQTTGESLNDSIASIQDEEPAAKHDQVSDKDVVQEDVRKMVSAVYGADVETVLGYTHPKIIDLLGGRSQAKSALETAFSQFQSLGMKLESMTFPDDPTFLKTDTNHFVMVPTKSIVSANGQRIESLNYQFGIRQIGTTKWKYIEGSRINQQNVTTLFPDFPTDYEFPKFYRKKL